VIDRPAIGLSAKGLSVCERIRVFVKLVRIVDDVPMFAHFVGKVRRGVGVADDVFHGQNFQKRKGKNTHMAKKTAPKMSKSLVFMAYGLQIENAQLYSRHAVTGKAKACQVPAH
jgi:hypothetical protein